MGLTTMESSKLRVTCIVIAVKPHQRFGNRSQVMTTLYAQRNVQILGMSWAVLFGYRTNIIFSTKSMQYL